MKAIVIKENGGPEKLTLTETATPAIQPHEVLVAVKAIGINPVDVFIRENNGALQGILQPTPGQDTFILGWDISGTVVATGSAVTAFKNGDDVFGMVNFSGQGKAYAEYVAAPAAHLALKPAQVSHEEAAAATLAALTAWQALVTNAQVKKNDKVLIHAAAGGVGHYAVQIAKHLGAYVIGTGSAASKELITSLGADEFIDYNQEKFEDNVKDADVVLDAIFGDHLLRSLDAVKEGGRVISLLTYFEGAAAEKAKAKNIDGRRIFVSSNGEDMQQIAALLADGSIRSHVSAIFAFEEMADAHAQISTGKTKGKVVVTI